MLDEAINRSIEKSYVIETAGDHKLLDVGDNSFLITDIIITNKGTNCTLRLHDDNGNHFEIVSLDDKEKKFCYGFAGGGLLSWKGAHLRLDVDSDKKITIVVCYIPAQNGLDFELWNQRR